MMFSEMFPHYIEGNEFGSMLCLKDLSENACEICGEITEWYEKAFFVPLCSEECLLSFQDSIKPISSVMIKTMKRGTRMDA
jgi:hypothetical protein